MKWLINGVSRDLVSRVHLFLRVRACVRACVGHGVFKIGEHAALLAFGSGGKVAFVIAATMSVKFTDRNAEVQ